MRCAGNHDGRRPERGPEETGRGARSVLSPTRMVVGGGDSANHASFALSDRVAVISNPNVGTRDVTIVRPRLPIDAHAEMEEQYQRFMSLSADHEAAAHYFVDHWGGAGAWDSMGSRGRTMVRSLVPTLRLEMTATRSDTAKLGWLAESPPPTIILVGENTLVAPRAVARVLAPALGATTVVVPGAGHMIPVTHPQAVVDAVRSDAAAERQARGAYA